MAMQGITATGSLTAAGQALRKSGKKLKAVKPGAESIIKPNTKFTIKKTQTTKTGILGKLKGLAGKVWGLAKAHPKTAIAIGAIAGVLGISKIAKKSQEKKAENLSINA